MPYFSQLDALRFAAALLVVWSHAIGNNAFHHGELGRLGVLVFFLISGFVNYQSLLKDASLSRFGIKRFFRLYPAFMVSLLAAAACWGITIPQLLCNVTMLPSLLGQREAIGVYWTLEIEVLFYLSLLFFSRLELLQRPVFLVAAISAFVTSGLYWQHLRNIGAIHPPDAYRKFLLFFAVLYLGALYGWAWQRSAWKYALFGTVLAMGALSIPSHARLWELATYWMSPVIFWGVLKWGANMPQWISGLGKLAYSMYLFHPFLVQWLPSNWVARCVALPILTIPLAFLVYFLVEDPLNRLGHHLAKAGRD
ncbi:MAG: acyltransferase [Verrucomicrobium sp.]|nr:acyltransferase [Verrucomicrobium sp.]